jgi:hypothetical protein
MGAVAHFDDEVDLSGGGLGLGIEVHLQNIALLLGDGATESRKKANAVVGKDD